MNMLRDMLQPPLRETVRSMFLEFGPSAVTVSFAEGDDATTALFSADPAAGTLALVNALDAADFAFNASTGVLTWAITPDYEAKIAHSVDISTTDGDGEVTLQRVTVLITPVSEFSPSFGATPTTVSVAEDVSAATFFTPSVTDADAGETITFALSGTHAALFTINAATGALRFTSAADFENGQGAGAGSNVYDVTITASDGTQSTAHGLQITVTDVADEAPVFTSATTASTPENNTGVFYTAAATGDAGSAVTFAIQGGYGHASAFSINGTSGAVSFEAPGADFEVLASYTLPIVATDAAGNAATLSLAITVTDVDEIAPVFTSAAAVSVVENILGTVYTAVATDASAVTFSLAAGVQDNDLFAIDGSSGAVTFNTSPDFETPADADTNNVYDLTITATDGSANVATLGVAITVTDVVAESSVPTAYLDLDFSSNSYRLADAASSFDAAFVGSSPKLTYGTTSNSTMVNSSGNIVWAPHNLLTYSEDFTDATWLKTFSVVAMDAVGPDGASNSAGTLTGNGGGTGTTYARVNVTVSTETTYTFSVFAKADQLSEIQLRCVNFTTPANGGVYFDLSAGAVGNAAGSGITAADAQIEDFGSGWYRCSITFTTDVADTSGDIQIYLANGGSSQVSRDGTSSVLLYGAQLYRSDLGGMAPVPGAATGFEYYVPTNGAAEYLPRVGHHVYDGSAWVNEGLLIESEARTNLLPNSATLSAQSVTVTAVPHTLSFTGSGTVTLSGVSTDGPLVGTGTGENNRVNLTFTPTAGTLTLAVYGTVSNAQLEVGSTPSSYMPTVGGTYTRTAQSLEVPPAEFGWNSNAVSIQMDGRITYADEGVSTQAMFYRWYVSGSDRIQARFYTNTGTGGLNVSQTATSGGSASSAINNVYTPGVYVPFNIASRHGSTFVNGAVDGVALTAKTTTTALPDLSSTNLQIAQDYMGTIGQFRQWDEDIGDTGIEGATS